MSNTSLPVLIIGAGVAGSVLAISLRQKGYEVILFEKYNGPAPGGASLNLAPNGLKVLGTLGLAEPLFSRGIAAPVEMLSYRTSDKVLVNSDIPLAVKEHFGFPFAGVKRNVFLQYLLENVQVEGIDIRYGHALKHFDQKDTSVLATFENGQQIMGSILIGCDGLHSQTRITLFGQEIPQYTGLTQTAGLTRVPHHHRKMQNIFGDNVHMISYAVGNAGFSDDNNQSSIVSWAITRQEKEGRESWKTDDSDFFRKELIGQLHCEWDNNVLVEELIANAPAILKFGLYDRKELSTWFKDRVVLIGDAAHPTAPHLGQGANQALEDVKMLSDLLLNHVPPSRISTTGIEGLKEVFESLNERRIPRTSTLVAKAREVGRLRVLPSDNVEAEKRNLMIQEEWSQSNEILLQMYDKLFGCSVAE